MLIDLYFEGSVELFLTFKSFEHPGETRLCDKLRVYAGYSFRDNYLISQFTKSFDRFLNSYYNK